MIDRTQLVLRFQSFDPQVDCSGLKQSWNVISGVVRSDLLFKGKRADQTCKWLDENIRAHYGTLGSNIGIIVMLGHNESLW